MNSEWTLTEELCKITNSESIGKALNKMGVINNEASHFEILQSGEWVRGGAETYIYKFVVKLSKNLNKEIILKACVAFSPGTTLESILIEWIKRRSLLNSNGISTPILYGYGNGIIIEEYINYKLVDVLRNKSVPKRSILIQLAQLAGVLEKLKFSPINPFDDLMSRGRDVVLVDFGQDLGPSNCKNGSTNILFSSLIDYIEKKGKISLSKDLHDEIYKIYNAEKGNISEDKVIN